MIRYMKIQILSVSNPIPLDTSHAFNAHAEVFGCVPKYAIVNGIPKFNLYEVVDKEKFFSSVEMHGIIYEEVDLDLKEFAV